MTSACGVISAVQISGPPYPAAPGVRASGARSLQYQPTHAQANDSATATTPTARGASASPANKYSRLRTSSHSSRSSTASAFDIEADHHPAFISPHGSIRRIHLFKGAAQKNSVQPCRRELPGNTYACPMPGPSGRTPRRPRGPRYGHRRQLLYVFRRGYDEVMLLQPGLQRGHLHETFCPPHCPG